jgi:hypothetical protein
MTPLPGLNPQRLHRLMGAAIERCDLRLDGFAVVTEAATGAYVVTPVLAAMAGAEVFAVTRATGFGTVEEVREGTSSLAAVCGVAERVRVFETLPEEAIRTADIVTNSGHVRPIDARMIALMKPGAAIPLMYESWEFRDTDLDLDACARRGIGVAGTNECHPSVDVFSFLGIMAAKLLLDAGVAVFGSDVLLLCDNPFGPFLFAGLRGAGARVHCARQLPAAASYDAIVVAMSPGGTPAIGARHASVLAKEFPGAVVADFWGGIDRRALRDDGVPFWPLADVPAGHMGILPSAIGPEPVIRLQCGGLKIGEIMARASRAGIDPVESAVRSGYGQALAMAKL